MEHYKNRILEKLLDIYERRQGYLKTPQEMNAVQFRPEEAFPEYTDRYDHEAYRAVNLDIEKLMLRNIIAAVKDSTGRYTKIRLNLEQVKAAYEEVGRVCVSETCKVLRETVRPYLDDPDTLVRTVAEEFLSYIDLCKKLPYGIAYDNGRLKNVMKLLQVISRLDEETYIRNFSEAVLKDSKLFQKQFRSVIQSILYDHTNTTVEKDRILEVYNLFDNPTYVLIKGPAVIQFERTTMYLEEMRGGTALPSTALEGIRRIQVLSDRVVTVENLTTYHDCEEEGQVSIYLGGFHNTPKQEMLKHLYAQNYHAAYFHKGDLDVYGFAILESLKERTRIPFEPLEMDVNTLAWCYQNGFYKELNDADRKAMRSKNLQKYQEVFSFMLEHNCKAEQETIKAAELLRKL